MKDRPVRPWYREPWPWILMSGPAVVVVAGIYTFVLAATTTDTLVSEDYYRKGLQVNREIACANAHADIRTPKGDSPCRTD